VIAVLIAIESTIGTLISATLAVGEKSCRRGIFFCASFALTFAASPYWNVSTTNQGSIKYSLKRWVLGILRIIILVFYRSVFLPWRIFHNLRLIHRMKKPAYVEPCIGWNDEDFKVGLRKFGVAELPTRRLPRQRSRHPCAHLRSLSNLSLMRRLCSRRRTMRRSRCASCEHRKYE
jgi:hypothetical protein